MEGVQEGYVDVMGLGAVAKDDDFAQFLMASVKNVQIVCVFFHRGGHPDSRVFQALGTFH